MQKIFGAKTTSQRDQAKREHDIIKWKALVTSFLMQSLILGTIESYGALYGPVRDTFFKDNPFRSSLAAMIGSLTNGCLMGFSPVSSYLVELSGPQIIAFVGGILVFLGPLFTSFVETFVTMALLYGLIFGIGASMIFISSNVVISRNFEENSTLAYGILGLGNGLMNAIMPHVISFCTEKIQLGFTFRLISLILSCIMFFPLYWKKDSRTDQRDENTLVYIPTKIKREDSIKLLVTEIENNIRKFIEQEKSNTNDTSNSSHMQTLLRSRSKINKPSNNDNKIILSKSESTDSSSDSKMVDPELAAQVKGTLSKSQDELRKHKVLTEDTFIKIPQHELSSSMALMDISFMPQTDENNKPSSSFTKDSQSYGLNKKYTRPSNLDDYSEKIPSKNDKAKAKANPVSRVVCFLCNLELCQSKPYKTMLIAMPIAMLGYQVPNVHIVSYSSKILPEYNAQMLLTCMGGFAAIGPFLTGLLLDRFKCHFTKYRLYQIFIMLYGTIILTLGIMPSYYLLMFVSMAIGFIDGSFTSLLGSLIIDLVGVKRAGKALGLFYGFIAPSVCIAPPLAGALLDRTASYFYPFFFAGVFFLSGGLLLSLSHSQTNEEGFE